MFPELARMAARDDWRTMRRVVVRQLVVTLVGAGGIALVLLSVLPVLIELIFGTEVLSDIALFRLTVIASLVTLAGFLLNPAFLSAGKAGTLLAIQAGAVLVFAAIALLAMPVLGLVAIGYALLGFHLAQHGLLLLIGRRLIGKRIRRNRAAGVAGSAPG
jgi:O-antigen/teichoic acid export membrane protein